MPIQADLMAAYEVEAQYVAAAEEVVRNIDTLLPRGSFRPAQESHTTSADGTILLSKNYFIPSELKIADIFNKMDRWEGVNDVWSVREINRDRNTASFLLLFDYTARIETVRILIPEPKRRARKTPSKNRKKPEPPPEPRYREVEKPINEIAAVLLRQDLGKNQIVSAKVMDLMEYRDSLNGIESGTDPTTADIVFQPFKDRKVAMWSKRQSVREALLQPRLP